MSIYHDDEFGEITIQKRRGMRRVHVKVGTNGRLVVTTPLYTPLFYVRQLITSSRDELRKLRDHTPSSTRIYKDGDTIGMHHGLAIVQTHIAHKKPYVIARNTLVVYISPDQGSDTALVQQYIRDGVISVLKREARTYLPKQLQALAREHGFSYQRTRLSHAGSRWGSCSSTGTISLNIALMTLPENLITYVLIHELCHTRHMNHSRQFWDEVATFDSHYRLHKRQLAQHSPII